MSCFFSLGWLFSLSSGYVFPLFAESSLCELCSKGTWLTGFGLVGTSRSVSRKKMKEKVKIRFFDNYRHYINISAQYLKT